MCAIGLPNRRSSASVASGQIVERGKAAGGIEDAIFIVAHTRNEQKSMSEARSMPRFEVTEVGHASVVARRPLRLGHAGLVEGRIVGVVVRSPEQIDHVARGVACLQRTAAIPSPRISNYRRTGRRLRRRLRILLLPAFPE
jgi:hypothetical protein